MIVDITNEVFTEIKTALTTVTVKSEYPSTEPTFPFVTVTEISNDTDESTIDSSVQHYSLISIEVNIYCNSSRKISDAKSIRGTIYSILGDKYNMPRTFSNQVPNFLDENVYRYIMRYTCKVDTNRKIYRR